MGFLTWLVTMAGVGIVVWYATTLYWHDRMVFPPNHATRRRPARPATTIAPTSTLHPNRVVDICVTAARVHLPAYVYHGLLPMLSPCAVVPGGFDNMVTVGRSVLAMIDSDQAPLPADYYDWVEHAPTKAVESALEWAASASGAITYSLAVAGCAACGAPAPPPAIYWLDGHALTTATITSPVRLGQ